MKNELFRRLYKQGRTRDCGLLCQLRNLSTLGPGNLQARIRLAIDLHEASKEFHDKFMEHASRYRASLVPDTPPFLKASMKWVCFSCGSPYCPDAVPVPGNAFYQVTS